MRLRSTFGFWSFLALLAFPARAQVITGSIVGTVTDVTGGVIQGAEATIRSPALLGGDSVTSTNERGRYRFPALPPGTYTLGIQAPGFARYVEDGIRVHVGGTVERNVLLQLATVTEELVVSREAPGADPNKSGVSTNYGVQYMEGMPLRRSGIYDLIKSAPGISATQPTDNFSFEVSAFGSGVNENAFLVDGSPAGGIDLAPRPPAAPGTDAIEEIEILSLGTSAEYGNFQGAVFNVVTRQGGNDWRFDASYYTTSEGLNSQPIKRECNCPEGVVGFRRQFHDATAYVGGPVLKDRLWVFGGLEHQRDHQSQPGDDLFLKWKVDDVFLKLTWQITPRLRSMHSFHMKSDSIPLPAWGGWAHDDVLVSYVGDYPSATLAHLTYTVSDDTMWDLRVSGTFVDYDTVPNNGDRTAPLHYDLATNVYVDGTYYLFSSKSSRYSVRSKLDHHVEDRLGGDHDLKLGVQFDSDETRTCDTTPGGAVYYDYAGVPVFAEFNEPSGWGAGSRSLGAFAEDVFHVGERLTLSLGLRFDYSRAISQDIPALDSQGRETDGVVEGLGTFFTWNTLSPRLGFNLALSKDRRSVLRGTWGRFNGGIDYSEFSWLHPAMTPITVAGFDPLTGEYSDIWDVVYPPQYFSIDPGMRTPRTDQLSIGFDRQLGSSLAVGMTYSRKRGGLFTGWSETLGVYGTDTITLDDGRTLEVYPLLSDRGDRSFLLTNPEGYYLQYDGLLLSLTKRWADRWQMLASYTWSRARGLQASQGYFSQNSAGGQGTYGTDPNHMINADGVLSNDRTHMLRAQATVLVPKLDVNVGLNFQYQTGKPWMAKTWVTLPQGLRRIFLEPRGSRRLPSQTLVDLRLSKALSLGKRGKLELLANVLNLLNDTAVVGLFSDDPYGPQFAVPTEWVEPRSLVLGVRLSY